MAIVLPAAYFQNRSDHTAETDRSTPNVLTWGPLASNSLKALGGINFTLGGACKVTQSGSPAMSVDIASGSGQIAGTEGAKQGVYTFVNDASVTVTVTAAHPTLPRIDLVTVTVRDQQYSGAFNDASFVVTAGTPAGSPVAPTAPADSLIIAQIAVAAAATQILNANITDRRFPITAIGGVYVCTSSTKPTLGLYEGMIIYMSDLDQIQYYTGTVWNVASIPGGAWTDFSASVGWTSAGTAPVIGNGTITASYAQFNKTFFYKGRISMGSTTTFGSANAWQVNLPVAAVGLIIGVAQIFDASTSANKQPGTIFSASGSIANFSGSGGPVSSTIPMAWAVSDRLDWCVTGEVT